MLALIILHSLLLVTAIASIPWSIMRLRHKKHDKGIEGDLTTIFYGALIIAAVCFAALEGLTIVSLQGDWK